MHKFTGKLYFHALKLTCFYYKHLYKKVCY